MKHFNKIAVLALGFENVGVLFFSMYSRAASPQASVTTASSNTLIALNCINFKAINSHLQCDGLRKWNSDGTYQPYTPTAGTALVITDMECTGEVNPASIPITASCYLGLPEVLGVQGNVTNSNDNVFQFTTHLTSGVTFTGFPGITLYNIVNTGNTYVNLQGYLIQTPS